jgi:hypothetical protein
MDTSLYVLRNEATTAAFRHDTLDDALDALNFEVGERDLWVLFELDRIGVASRRVAGGRGHINRPRSATVRDPDEVALDDAALEDEIAFEWQRLHAIARLARPTSAFGSQGAGSGPASQKGCPVVVD